MAEITEDKKTITLSIGLMRMAIPSLVVIGWIGATIYWNFQAQTRELYFLTEKMEYARERTDRKVNPIKADLEALKTELMLEKIEILEMELKLERNR